ncbi:MAG: YetF domain-containing protein [Bacteroidota bacterium]
MKKEDIHWADWHRILIGAAPTEFLLEVLIRTVIMYVVLLIILRLLGKRMGGMLTISELAIMVTLGAIICVPMQIPDRGVVQGIFVLICALVFHQGLSLVGYKSETMEKLIQGKESLIIKNGMIVVKELDKAQITRQQLYAVLRSQGINNLGQVERVYMEGAGLFSVYRFPEPRPGLSVLPPKDDAVQHIHDRPQGIMVCTDCGKVADNETESAGDCSNCNRHNWQPATI